MSALIWSHRRQWVTHLGHSGLDIEITITRFAAESQWYWYVDGFDRSRLATLSEFSKSAASSLTEAKRRAAQQADALLVRMVAARGGA